MASDRINPGHLNRMITLQYPVSTRGTSGSVKEAWTDWATQVPASQGKLTKPTEGFKQDLMIALQYTVWEFHFLDMAIEGFEVPDTRMRLFDEDYPKRIYTIEAVEEIGQRAGWRLYTKLKNA